MTGVRLSASRIRRASVRFELEPPTPIHRVGSLIKCTMALDTSKKIDLFVAVGT